MKRLFLSLLICLILFSCQQTESRNEENDSLQVEQKKPIKIKGLTDKGLISKIEDISSLHYYDDFVTLFPDSTQLKFYRDSILRYHPYRYLRDSTNTQDLELLLFYDHPYVKLYAFKALVHRKTNPNKLYSMVLKNLLDTTRIEVASDDLIWGSSPANMMIYYTLEYFDKRQKDTLRDLILTKHSYLQDLNEVLLYLKPQKKYYEKVKEFTQSKHNTCALIALAAYQKPEDVPLIMKGFDTINYYSGTYIFFKAIENYPHPSFFPLLLDYHHKIQVDQGAMDDYMYYYRAVARYQNKEGLAILKEMAQRKYYNSEGYWHSNLVHIYKAIKKYNCPIYEPLQSQIQKHFKDFNEIDRAELKQKGDYLSHNPWNY